MSDAKNDAGGGVDPPEQLLPEDSVLDLSDYLAMQQAIGDETRYQILRTLAHNGDLSATQLRDALDLASNNLHYHLDKLVEVGLVQNRKRAESDRDGLYSYYRISSLGDGMLEHGVEELMRRERDFRDRYA